MAEDNNAFGQFGARSAKFDELLKKYQTIDEGDTVSAQAYDVRPEAEQQAEIVPEPIAEAPIQPDGESAEIVQIPEEESVPEANSESQPEARGFDFDEQVATRGIEQNSLAESEKEESEAITEPQEEPDYSYDIDIFSAGGASATPDIDSFDDSWIDSALDDSFFYKPEVLSEPEHTSEIEQSAESESEDDVTAQPQAVPVTEYEQEYYTDDRAQYSPEDFNLPEQNDSKKDVMAGGYIAPSDFSDFEFEPESGMDFEVNDTPDAVSAKKPEKAKRKTVREKKDSGKNEMSSVTGFSKNYKASEGKGSKKDGFLVRNFVPKSSDTGLEKARKIIMIACVITFIVAAVYLFGDFVIQPFVTENRLEKLEEMVGKGDNVADKAELADKYPDVEFPEGMLEKYTELYAENSDLAGWINIDGLGISLPVVQGKDNTEYLKRDFDGNYNKYGSVFMNSANDVRSLNYNTALFGHHMLDTKMFGNLTLYKDVEYYKKAPVIEFNTIYGDYKWKIFAVFITNGTAEGDDGYIFDYTFTDLSSPEAVERFLGEIDQRSIYKPEVDISVSDKILTLSTCSYEFDEARLVVMARMVRPGESESVSGKVIANDNPRYPAAYYEKKGLTNPYASAYKWQPA